MALSGKHLFGEIDGKRGTIIEKKATQERVEFLKKLLEYNGFEVLVQENKRRKEDEPVTFTIGVTDLLFNPVIWIYERRLKTPDGKIVTQDYWLQKGDNFSPFYWKAKYSE